MSNSYFEFKQFRVDQDQCGMKVSTDACIQGAWASIPATAERVLDVGTGTGLLSLMLAQRFPDVTITALELDPGAALQATNNIAASPFASRISVLPIDANAFIAQAGFDFIICNPPFFKQSLLGPDLARNTARHHLSLIPSDLLQLIKRTLNVGGAACFIWPLTEHGEWEKMLLANKFHLQRQLHIRDREDAKVKRVISICTQEATSPSLAETLTIKEPSGAYTGAFKALLEPFYLHL